MINETKPTPGFSITRAKGFGITFANGWSLSVQWGPGNYCSHHHEHDLDAPLEVAQGGTGRWTSATAEIAVIDPGTSSTASSPSMCSLRAKAMTNKHMMKVYVTEAD